MTAFVQDEIGLLDRRLSLTLGTKLLRTNFTGSGAELEPSARLLWTPTETQTVWAAFTHALRTPSDAEANFNLSGYIATTAGGVPFSLVSTPTPISLPNSSMVMNSATAVSLGTKFYVDVVEFL